MGTPLVVSCKHADVSPSSHGEAGVWMRAAVIDSEATMIELGHCRECARNVRRIRCGGEFTPWILRGTLSRFRP